MSRHPLDPLSADEFRQTAAVLRRDGLVTEAFRFTSIELKEPAKAAVKAWRPGDQVQRSAFAIVLDRTRNTTHEAVVDLTGDLVVSSTTLPASSLISPWMSSMMSTMRCAPTLR